MLEETEIYITPRQAHLLYTFFSVNHFYSSLDSNGLNFGWKDPKSKIEWLLMAYKNNELRVYLTNIRDMPKKTREATLEVIAETKILEILEDLDIKI